MGKTIRCSSYLTLPLCLASLLQAESAWATDATEFPDNGSEQGGRGGAWVARASDPLAAFYNPAGLAGQPTRLTLNSNFNSQRTCFTRVKAKNDTTADGVNAGGSYPQVCSDAQYNLDPQLGMTIRISKRVGVGILPFLGPSAANGMANYPEFAKVGGMPNTAEPGRYLLTSQNVLLLTPTIGVGAEIVDRLRVGASFQWGIATFSFTNASASLNEANQTPAANDIKATLKGKDIFVPGFTLGALYSALDSLDIAGWYKWSAPINASGDVQTFFPYYQAYPMNPANPMTANTDTSQASCVPAGMAPKVSGNPCGSGNNASIHLARPMEAKIGVRFHMPRKDIPYDEHLRDPIAQDVFDVEVDGTWANNSSFDFLYIRFPQLADGAGSLPINGTPGVVPPNADVPLHYSDVFGVRVGGDWNVMPDKWAVRAGGFFQSAAQTGANTQYQGIAFTTGWMSGLALGTTYRLHFGPAGNAIELSAGYEHVFLGDETNDGQTGIQAIAGTPCNGAGGPTGCANKSQPYRTVWAVNLGTITNSINVINAGLGYRF